MLRQAQQKLLLKTHGRGFLEFSSEARAFLHENDFVTGQLTIFCRHTSASLLIQENADPSVLDDLKVFFDRIAPEGAGLYAHRHGRP